MKKEIRLREPPKTGTGLLISSYGIDSVSMALKRQAQGTDESRVLLIYLKSSTAM